MYNLYKNRIGIVHEQVRTKNTHSQNCPASLVLHFVCKASACQFGLTHFFTTLLVHSLSAIFTQFCTYAMFLALLAASGRELGGVARKAKCQRHCVWGEIFAKATRLSINEIQALADKMQLFGIDLDKNAIQRIECGKRFITDIELLAFSKVLNTSLENLLK